MRASATDLPPLLRFIGSALRLLRHQRGIRQYEAARRARVTKAVLSAYENRRRLPSRSCQEVCKRASGGGLLIGGFKDLLDDSDAVAVAGAEGDLG